MAIKGIGQIQYDLYLRQQQAAAMAVSSGAIQAPVSRPVSTGTSSSGIDFVKFGELVRSNALKNAGVTTISKNPVTAPPELEEPTLLKVSAGQVKNIFGAKPEYANANAYKGYAAVGEYAAIADRASKKDYSMYDALAKVKLG